MIFTLPPADGDPVIFANEAFLGLMGYARDEVLGRPFASFLNQPVVPNSSAWLEPHMTFDRDGTFHAECRRKDRTVFAASILMSPVLNKQGEMTHIVSAFVDLTGHESALREATKALHELYNGAPGFIATTSGPDHRFTFANLSYLALIGKKAIVGQTVAEVLPEIVHTGGIAILDEVYRSGQPFEGRGVRFDFSRCDTGVVDTRYLDFIYQPIKSPAGEITGLFVEGHDVTLHRRALEEQRSLENQLIHYSRLSAMGTMAATLAHELHQPLASVSNYVSACARMLQSSSNLDVGTLQAGLDGIAAASDRASGIIRQLKHIISRGKPQPELIDLNKVAQEAVDIAHSEVCGSATVEFLPCKRAWALADRIQIQQVVINLVRNACEAVQDRKDQRVSVTTRTSGPNAIVSVEDSGGGVPAAVENVIFQWSESAKPNGMGIGLAISRAIVEAHEGRIWLESTGADGTKIAFSLPRAEPPAGD
jgi:two-component system sensor kinase FixL